MHCFFVTIVFSFNDDTDNLLALRKLHNSAVFIHYKHINIKF